MKPRRVMLMIEVQSDMPLTLLRKAAYVGVWKAPDWHDLPTQQVQANVIRANTRKGGLGKR